MTSRGCLITPGCACTRCRPNASRRNVSLVSRLNVSASRATETNPRPPTASPSSAPPRLARSRSRTWTSARRTRRRPPSRSPRRTWSSCSCAGGGSPRTAAAAHPTRWRTATPRRGRRNLRVVLVFFFRENAFRMACSVNDEREERRLWTVRDAGSGAVASGPVTQGTGRRERERGRPRRFFPESCRAGPRGVSGETRRGARGGRDGKTGPFIAFGDVTHRQPWLARRS